MIRGKAANTLRFVHLTDPHLTQLNSTSFFAQRGKRKLGYLSWKRKRRKIHLRSVLDALCESLKKEQADQILITGDLVNICLKDEAQQALAWLKDLADPEKITFVPGNHDIYVTQCWPQIAEIWSDYLKLGDQPISALPADSYPLESDFGNFKSSSGSFKILSLCSSEAMPPFSAQGRMGTEQLQRLEKLLNNYAESGIACGWILHHPPLVGLTGRRRALIDAAALQKLIERFKPLFVLHGHNHRNMESRVQSSRIYGTASASSIYDAGYRVIDVQQSDGRIQLDSELKQYQANAEDNSSRCISISQDSWSV